MEERYVESIIKKRRQDYLLWRIRGKVEVSFLFYGMSSIISSQRGAQKPRAKVSALFHK